MTLARVWMHAIDFGDGFHILLDPLLILVYVNIHLFNLVVVIGVFLDLLV